MAIVKILEQCQVSAPPGSVPSSTLPLTFWDMPWLQVWCPVQRLFFFDFPHPTNHFLHTLLPILKHSLSLSLQHFFPFASNLVLPPDPLHLHRYLLYRDGDSLPFTVAESFADFSRLVSDSPTHVADLHHLVPMFPSPSTLEDGTRLIPLMTIQVTVLPNSGLAICIAFAHVAGDGRAFRHFMKFWAAVCRARGDLGSLPAGSPPLPCHSRDIIEDPKGLKLVYLKELPKIELKSMEFAPFVSDVSSDKVRATFVLKRNQVDQIKRWVSIRCIGDGTGTTHISTFVLTCSLMWVCMIKSEESQDQRLDEPCKLIFLADCRNHPDFTIPSAYFGNCLTIPIVVLERGRLVGENGFVEAVNAIESRVRERKSDPLTGAEKIMSDLRNLSKSEQPALTIAGSPRLGAYETDFGWGKPRKSEVVHIEFFGCISLSDSRQSEVAIEIGVALRRTRMSSFADNLEKQLRNIN
ncbi:coumaroyl-CoA:anthocyanidin 3-O-glucoside-6''-O-coumaroyltransferase 2-like [Prosopis cineraria]|uniref:coumaroyl-CoA:anthocyanidin 3-O-glucoside-6''-O-coumaroyltransferase 2-like n=1 Tax=Prosopis cineraria TaxID=364024 RepID=UPI00240FA0C2|nr:coumaroyl-CoA:anthocyanidin 3-O-glucoside-6''-O-coumaroyltransferase 2-like [Prosopis cineraria]